MEKINPLIVFSSFFILGIVSFFTHTVIFLAFLLLILLIWALLSNKISNKEAVIYYLAFSLALVNCKLQIKNYDDLSKYVPSEAVIHGTVESIPTTNRPDRTKFYLKVDSGVFNGEKAENLNARTIVTIYDSVENYSKIKIADKVELSGKLLSPIKAKNPSQFDYASYLKNKNTFSTFYVKNSSWKVSKNAQTFVGKFLQKLNDTRSRILKYQAKYMKPDNLEVLGGIVFGDDAINPPEHIKNSFINSGLLHILAASGMNVSIIFGIWFFIGTRLRLNYRFNILAGVFLVAFYTLMTGMGPSVLRAALMIEFVLLGKLINRNADSIALVFFVAFLMLLYNPAMINDVGFQLSFVVTFALMFYCPPVLGGIKNRFWEFLAGAVLIPFVAQLWASPIQMFYFNTYAVYSVAANFVITFFIMVISFLGFLGSILAMVPVDAFADKICMVFAFMLNPVVSILINISNFFASLPHSLVTTIHPHALQMIFYYGALVVFGFALRDKFRDKRILVLSGILILLLGLSFIKISPKTCEVIVFDVGNADSFLIKTPERKYILIDTAHGKYPGSKNTFSQADSIMNKYFKDNGIKKIDLLILTHFDADHSGGAVDVMKAVKVGNVILNRDKDDSKTTKAIMQYIKTADIPYTDAVNNKTVYKEQDDFTIKTYNADFTQNKNDNDNSTAALLSYKDFDMLFMADGGVRTFNKIKKDIDNTDIEILKSGHHGAKNTVTSKMLKTLNADAAIISTGYNSYGHPAKETLRTFSKNDVKVYRTDVDNAVKIQSDGSVYRIYKYSTTGKKFVKDFERTCKE